MLNSCIIHGLAGAPNTSTVIIARLLLQAPSSLHSACRPRLRFGNHQFRQIANGSRAVPCPMNFIHTFDAFEYMRSKLCEFYKCAQLIQCVEIEVLTEARQIKFDRHLKPCSLVLVASNLDFLTGE